MAFLLLSSALAYLVWTVASLEANVRRARALGLPFVRIPFGVNSYAWVIVQPLVWRLLVCLPIPWRSYPDFVRYSHRNWHFLEKSRPTASLGPAWALVSPQGITLHFADPDVIDDIFSRWRDFVRPVKKHAGHLRAIRLYRGFGGLAPPSQGRGGPVRPASDGVGVEGNAAAHAVGGFRLPLAGSKRLTRGRRRSMVHGWVARTRSRVPSLDNDLRTLTFNVLGATAFREPAGTQSHVGPRHGETATQTITQSYRDTLQTVIENAILLMIVPYHLLLGTRVPKRLAKAGHAAASFKSILLNVLAEETAALDDHAPGRGGLLTPLVRALRPDVPEQAKNGATATSARVKKGGLSADEILGNSFVINFAGHDTVLLTLNFALTMLAVHPDVQEWLGEEITAVSGPTPVEQWDYDLFPRLKRCQAGFLETLRVFAPITGIPKMASDKAPSLRVGDRLQAIPPGTEVFPLLVGVQTDPRYWKDPYEWRPSRWIVRGPAGQEQLFEPRKGIYFPWAGGPQNCAGKMFSQVEGVAVLAGLLRGHRLRVEAEAGETPGQARSRTRACADDVNYDLLLRMNHPERVKLRCVRYDTGE
ncbi:Cytochrome P450 4V2 [Tolypocladium ophioglossoides CBS 100239]|uniref:Cytochrome P450 4V2 n=1 Tax=Tolypocladium ophioglossoides (strain CBS 100239) TaxID=1163406 RepID=A0A0L0N3P6_TOLOC|nr:Cytochrome P450 4V2 [Tolypocladium ophioglossoides CBS 100239]